MAALRGFKEVNELISYAKTFLGTPYIWGGEHPANGFDCSGFVQFILQSVGADPFGDQTAQALYDHLFEFAKITEPQAGALCFYGKTGNDIRHVALMINSHQIIEAGGGGPTTKTVTDAISQNACVRIRPYNQRKDLVAVIMPKYPEWVING